MGSITESGLISSSADPGNRLEPRLSIEPAKNEISFSARESTSLVESVVGRVVVVVGFGVVVVVSSYMAVVVGGKSSSSISSTSCSRGRGLRCRLRLLLRPPRSWPLRPPRC